MERYLRVNFFGTGPSSYDKRLYVAAVSQGLRNTEILWDITYYWEVPKISEPPDIALPAMKSTVGTVY